MYRTWTNRGCNAVGFMLEGGQVRSLSPANRKATFDSVRTGAKVTVQMTIVVDTADCDHLISDITEDGHPPEPDQSCLQGPLPALAGC